MAISVNFHNLDLDLEALRAEQLPKLQDLEVPAFETHKENIAELAEALKPYQKYQHLILVANGGSVWSFMAYFKALGAWRGDKTVVALTDMEPDYLDLVKKQCPVDDTIVIYVSKSGSTVGVVEDVFALSEYKHIYVTDASSPLGQIAAHRDELVLNHPPVGGRYSGFTASAYVPALLTDLEVEKLEHGGRSAYHEYGDVENVKNTALLIAIALLALEEQGYTEIFMPIYSNFLQVFGMVITQLFHESFGKDGKGMTVLAAQAPESQHHTNQRFFGGRKNMVGCFIHVESQKDEYASIEVPHSMHEIALRSGTLAGINGLRLAHSYMSEYVGTLTDAKNKGIPLIDVALSEISEESVGAFMAFWHYVTVYSSILRGVDPYDQPQVESSKVISFEERMESK